MQADTSRPVEDLIVAIFRAHGAVIANGNRLVEDLGLSVALWQVLDALDRGNGRLSVADIARAMSLVRQSVQRSVNVLADRDLVVFAANPAHKRAQLVSLTGAGRTALNALNQRVAGSIADVLKGISAADIKTARATLAAFTAEQQRQLDRDA